MYYDDSDFFQNRGYPPGKNASQDTMITSGESNEFTNERLLKSNKELKNKFLTIIC